MIFKIGGQKFCIPESLNRWFSSLRIFLLTGNQRCFLFSLQPTMKIYPTLPHNDHFLYLNVNQKALPNGLVSWFSFCNTRVFKIKTEMGGGSLASVIVWYLWYVLGCDLWVEWKKFLKWWYWQCYDICLKIRYCTLWCSIQFSSFPFWIHVTGGSQKFYCKCQHSLFWLVTIFSSVPINEPA